LTVCVARYRQLPPVSKLIHAFLKRGQEAVALARSQNWVQLLSAFVGACFAEPRHPSFLESIDLSSVIDSLSVLVTASDRDSVQPILLFFDQLSRSRSHSGALKAFLVKGADLGAFSAHDVMKLIPAEFAPARLLEIEVRNLQADNFMPTITRLVQNQKISPASLLAVLTSSEPELHDSLVQNCQFLIEWLGDRMTNFVNSVSSLLKTLCQPDIAPVFSQMRAFLASAPKVAPAFLSLLLWMLISKNHPRDDVLEGIDRQPPSDELACVQAFFGMDAFVEHVGAKLARVTATSLVLKQFEPFIVVLPYLSNELFVKFITSQAWSEHFAKRLVNASSEAEYKQIEKIIKWLIERQDVCDAVSSILLRLILCQNASYTLRFVSCLPSVRRITEDDMELLNTGVGALLGRQSDMEQPLSVICPLMLGLFAKRPSVSFALDATKVVQCVGVRPSRTAGCLVVSYVSALCKANPAFCAELRRVQKGHFEGRIRGIPVSCLTVLLWDRVAVETGEDELAVFDDLQLGQEQLEAISGDKFAEDIWGLYKSWLVGRDIAKSFVMNLFQKTRLVLDGEKQFFESVLRALPEADARGLLTAVCNDVKDFIANNGAVLYAARRAAFAARALPEKRADVLALIPESVRATFPRKIAEWQEIVGVLGE
jgi:hypothetical protein